MKFTDEYKKQGIYIIIGFISLLFPFLNIWYFIIGFFGCAFIFYKLSPESHLFNFVARESDIKKGKLNTLTQLFFTIGILFLMGKFFNLPLFIIGAAVVITTFGDGFADIINIYYKLKNSNIISDAKIYSANSSIVFLISGSIFAFLIGVWIARLTLPIPYDMIFFLVVIGTITGALLESITKYEDNITIPLGSAMAMWLFYNFSYYYGTLQLMQVLIFAFVLGYISYLARIADVSAMLSATLFGVVIIISTGYDWFLVLLAFFLLGSMFTHYKYEYKLSHGLAEKKKGMRGYKNIFSNSLASLCLAVAHSVYPEHNQILLYAYLGSIATATGDTLASEIGGTYKGEPIMITTFKKVKAGTDGGISVLGEFASLFGSFAIALIAFILIQDDVALLIAVTLGGFIGTNIDSVLGATFQQKGYLSNNGVNFFATISGAIVSGMLYLMGS